MGDTLHTSMANAAPFKQNTPLLSSDSDEVLVISLVPDNNASDSVQTSPPQYKVYMCDTPQYNVYIRVPKRQEIERWVCVGASPWPLAPNLSLPTWAPACTTEIHVDHIHPRTNPPLRPLHSFLHIRVNPTGRFTIHLRDCHETYTRQGQYCNTANHPLNTQIRRAGRELFEATPGSFTEINEHDYLYLSCDDRRTGCGNGISPAYIF